LVFVSKLTYCIFVNKSLSTNRLITLNKITINLFTICLCFVYFQKLQKCRPSLQSTSIYYRGVTTQKYVYSDIVISYRQLLGCSPCFFWVQYWSGIRRYQNRLCQLTVKVNEFAVLVDRHKKLFIFRKLAGFSCIESSEVNISRTIEVNRKVGH
jgi:hypothetical protein